MTGVAPRTRQSLDDLVKHCYVVARLVTRGKSAYDADEVLRYAAEDLLIRLGECVSRIDRHKYPAGPSESPRIPRSPRGVVYGTAIGHQSSRT